MVKQSEEIPVGFKMTELGILPEEWHLHSLGSVFNIKQGKSISAKKNLGRNPKPFLRTANVFWGKVDLTFVDMMDFEEDEFKQLCLNKDDLLVCEGGDIGRTAIWSDEMNHCAYQNHLHRLRPSQKDVYPLFYMYWMQEAILNLGLYIGSGNKTTIPNLSQSRLKAFMLPKPPISEQRAIAHVLATIQRAIEAQDKVIAAARELKKSLMRHLFTYGPVPVNETDQVELKETEIGLVPENWDVVQVEDMAMVQCGYAFKSNDYVDIGVPLLKIANVSFGKVIWDDISFLPESYVTQHKEYLLQTGDLVMAMTRPIVSGGIKIARLLQSDSPSLLNQRVCRFNPKSRTDIEYLFHMLFNRYFLTAIGDGASGSQQPNISAGNIEKIMVPRPALQVQHKVADIFKAIDAKIQAEENRKAALQILFKTMLHLLMTGKVRVKDLDLTEEK